MVWFEISQETLERGFGNTTKSRRDFKMI